MSVTDNFFIILQHKKNEDSCNFQILRQVIPEQHLGGSREFTWDKCAIAHNVQNQQHLIPGMPATGLSSLGPIPPFAVSGCKRIFSPSLMLFGLVCSMRENLSSVGICSIPIHGLVSIKCRSSCRQHRNPPMM
jgi:hypothetical protein